MTYDQLLTLDSIVKEGSFKSASKVLHKTQPSLSAAIKKLEEEYQIQIFSRENYRPELTPTGQAFYNMAKPALETFKELDKYGKELSMGYETEISLSIDAICPIENISPVLEKFFNPQVTTSLNLNIDILEGLVEKLVNHEVDFAIGSYINPHEDIEAVKLFPSTMVPVISPKFAESLNCARELKKLPQIIVKSSSKSASNIVVGSLNGAKRWFTTDMYMKERLILNGLGWGRLPLHQIKDKLDSGELMEVTGIKEVEKIDVQLYLLKSKTKTLGPNSRNLWQYLLEECGR